MILPNEACTQNPKTKTKTKQTKKNPYFTIYIGFRLLNNNEFLNIYVHL